MEQGELEKDLIGDRLSGENDMTCRT